MSCEIKSVGELLTVMLDGEIDHHTAKDMREKIDEAIEFYMPTLLIMDFGRVSFMDSSGIGLVMGRYKTLQKKGAKSILIAIIYISCLFLGIGLMIFLFTTRKIENNTAPAMKLCCFLLLGIINTTIGFFIENNNIKKWIPDQRNYQISKSSIGCMFLGLLSYLLMCIL